jgi:hypothetical protein
MKQSLSHTELAFLSAGETAKGDAKLPDEAIHLAAGMLMAGYGSVVATMSPIGSGDAAIITDNISLTRLIKIVAELRMRYTKPWLTSAMSEGRTISRFGCRSSTSVSARLTLNLNDPAILGRLISYIARSSPLLFAAHYSFGSVC